MDRRLSNALRSLIPLLLVSLVAVWSLAVSRPPDPMPASAEAEEFSAERAAAHVRALGGSPRPVGSREHAAARERLVETLRALGLDSEVQDEKMVLQQEADRYLAVRVRNVVARLSGSSSDGALLLVAHYDSRPNTPGAGDDLAGVGAILECLRALRAGAPLRNDLIVLFADAEELGLVGARAFVERHRWAGDVQLVLNLEGRGSEGPAMMFETGPGNLELIRAFRAAVPYPSASSLSYEVYRRMPNDTDFSVFRDAGVQGLNIAFLDHHPAYHTMLDTPERLDTGTLQHHGSYALGVARHFGNANLSTLGAPHGADAIYFNPYPWRLIVYPAAWALPLALTGLALLLVGIWLCRRRGRLELGGVGRGVALFGVTIAAGALVGFCFWWLIRNHLSGMLFGPHGLTYATGWLVAALVLLIAGCAGVLAIPGDGKQMLERWAGGWLGWAAASILLAIFVPGASYLTTWPLLVGAVGLMASSAPGIAGRGELAEPLIIGLTAGATVLLLAPMGWTVALALGLGASAAIGAVIGLALTTVLPLLGAIHLSSRGKSSLALLLAGLAILVWTAVRAEPSAARPAVDTLAYGLDTESGEAWWLSFDRLPDPWTVSYLGEVPVRGEAPSMFGLLGAGEVLLAPAPPARLAAPAAATLSDSRAIGRRVGGLVRSMRRAPVLRIRAEASVPYSAFELEGERFEFSGDPDAAGLGEIWIVAIGFEDGVRVVFELDEAWPVELELTDTSWSFEALAEPPVPRPDHLIPSSSWRTDAVYVRSSSLL